MRRWSSLTQSESELEEPSGVSEEVHSGELLPLEATPTTQHVFQVEGDGAVFLSESEGEGVMYHIMHMDKRRCPTCVHCPFKSCFTPYWYGPWRGWEREELPWYAVL